MTEKKCQHRWEESDFGKKYWEPGTRQYTCARCGKMNMIRLGVDYAPDKTENDSEVIEAVPGRADSQPA